MKNQWIYELTQESSSSEETEAIKNGHNHINMSGYSAIYSQRNVGYMNKHGKQFSRGATVSSVCVLVDTIDQLGPRSKGEKYRQ